VRLAAKVALPPKHRRRCQ